MIYIFTKDGTFYSATTVEPVKNEEFIYVQSDEVYNCPIQYKDGAIIKLPIFEIKKAAVDAPKDIVDIYATIANLFEMMEEKNNV